MPFDLVVDAREKPLIAALRELSRIFRPTSSSTSTSKSNSQAADEAIAAGDKTETSENEDVFCDVRVATLDLGDAQIIFRSEHYGADNSRRKSDPSTNTNTNKNPNTDAGAGGGGSVFQNVLFERKTVSDLCASIKDGRYAEQKKRVRSCARDAVVVYVIENYVSFSSLADAASQAGLHPDALHSCVYSLMFRSGFYVVFTRDLRDTAQFVYSVWCRRQRDERATTGLMLLRSGADAGGRTKKIGSADTDASSKNDTATPQKNGGEDIIEATPSSSTDDMTAALVAASVHSKRSKNITHKTCYIMQLAQVPGVSGKTAALISERWPSMVALYDELTRVSPEERIRRLARLPTVGMKSAAHISAFLFGAPRNQGVTVRR